MPFAVFCLALGLFLLALARSEKSQTIRDHGLMRHT